MAGLGADHPREIAIARLVVFLVRIGTEDLRKVLDVHSLSVETIEAFDGKGLTFQCSQSPRGGF